MTFQSYMTIEPVFFISFSNLNFNHYLFSDHFASVFFSHVHACSANALANTTTGKRRMDNACLLQLDSETNRKFTNVFAFGSESRKETNNYSSVI